jgi:hypothetical protein
MAARGCQGEDGGVKNNTVSLAIREREVEHPPKFNVVLAYEEIVGGMEAKQFFGALAVTHQTLFQFRCQIWKFEVLGIPQLFEAAVRDASRADMIVIAKRKPQFSGEVKRWMQISLASRGARSHRLVVLLSGKATRRGGESEACASARQLVKGSGASVLCKEIEWGITAPEFAGEVTEARPKAGRRLPAFFSMTAGQPRWGINE